jgi:hypothetical protein
MPMVGCVIMRIRKRTGDNWSRLVLSADLFAMRGSVHGSVSCGSGWSVPCVSIQLTLSQMSVRALGLWVVGEFPWRVLGPSQ